MTNPKSKSTRTARDWPLAEQLARRLGPQSEWARESVHVIFRLLRTDGISKSAETSLARWRTDMATASGIDLERSSVAIEALAKTYSIREGPRHPAELLFAVHTYYAQAIRELIERMVPRSECAEGWFPTDLFAWCKTDVCSTLDQSTIDGLTVETDNGCDVLGGLYQAIFPRKVRHVLGEYYTPDWLVQHVLDQVEYPGRSGSRLLDPACGSGAFLTAAVRRLRSQCENDMPANDMCRLILEQVVGFDLHPLAVLTSRANYLLALRDVLPEGDRIHVPVTHRDAILDPNDNPTPFDFVVGNPPWIAWDHLPVAYREATKPLWQRYGLFSLSGSEARHGGGKKDLSMLLLYASADRYLRSGGHLAMVVTQTVFQTKGAGDGFRRFRLGDDGAELCVLRVDDLADLKPFSGAANWTATIVLEKGRPTVFPVPYIKWTHQSGSATFGQEPCEAEPIDAERPSSPWFVRTAGCNRPIDQMIGPSDYKAHLGANSGGANGVYWLELLEQREEGILVRNMPGRGKRTVPCIETVLEPDLIYPLLRWGDVGRFQAVPRAHLLLSQDVERRRGIDISTLRSQYPLTYAYLKRFEKVLRDRAAYRRYQNRAAFYSMYNVGPYTVSQRKVVWRRMDHRINAAVLGPIDDAWLGWRTIIPQETCVLIATISAAEAHYLCALLNSERIGRIVTSHSVRGGKGFGTPSMLDYLRLVRFDPGNRLHTQLTDASIEAHDTAAEGENLDPIMQRIDRLAEQVLS